ncbi:MAG: NFACT family protein [Aeropyrum sp.]|nr:NFACT family protein [Aeropyrum sp.]MCE4615622.1 NFACT family protein [Aeropyrum sp.]
MARKAMNSLDVRVVVGMLASKLSGSRLDNVYWLESGEGVLLKVKGPGVQAYIVAEPAVRLHLTSRPSARREATPTGLVAVLRKWVRGSRIESIEQLGFDRLVRLSFSTGHKLYVELVPRGLTVLVSPEDTIIAASRYEEFRDRAIKPKMEYRPPPLLKENPFTLEPKELAELAARGSDIVRGLIRGAKIPGEAAEEALDRCGIDYGLDPSSLSDGEWSCVGEALAAIYEESLRGKGYVCGGGGGDVSEANPFSRLRLECREYGDFNEALDDYFASNSSQKSGGVESGEVAKLKKSMEEAARLAEDYMKKAEVLRKAAEAIASSYGEVEEALRWASKGVARGPVVEVRGGRAILEVGGARIEADAREGVDKLVLRLFREAGEYEAKARRAREALAHARSKLEEAVTRARLRQFRESFKRRKRFWFERYHWTITRGGFLVIGGRDASQNESVVKRYLGENDIFLHADVHGAPATVILTKGREPSEPDIYDAAILAAAYSRAWKAGAGEVSVYWVKGSQVSKTPPAGEYLARGAFMVYGRRNYVHHVPLRLALGVSYVEGMPTVLAGSEESVSKFSSIYGVLIPGDLSVRESASRLKTLIAKRLEKSGRDDDSLMIAAMPEEEFESRIPGRSRIVKVAIGDGDNRSLVNVVSEL